MSLKAAVIGRIRGLATAVFAVALLAAGAAPGHATKIERVISAGGIEAWLVREPAVPLIAIEFAFTGGANQDPQGKPGTAAMAANLMDEGAGEFDSQAFQERLESKAIELTFRAGRDYVYGTMRTLAENRDEAFNYLRLALTAPRFDAEAIERVRAQTLSRLRRESTNPNEIASKRWWETAFAGHPYGQPVNGSLESVPRITADDLKAYTGRILARERLKIAIVGDITAEEAKRLLDYVFGALPAKPQLQSIPDVKPAGAGQPIVVPLDVPQGVVVFGGQGLARSDPDFLAAYVVNHILGGGTFSSRLYREVREKRGLAYEVSQSLIWYNHAAVRYGSTATRADRIGETIDIIKSEIRRLRDEGPTAEELTEAKAFLKSSYVLGLDTSGRIASQLVQIQLDNLGIDYIERRGALIDAVTLEDAKRVAKRLLGGDLLVTVVGRPQAAKPKEGG